MAMPKSTSAVGERRDSDIGLYLQTLNGRDFARPFAIVENAAARRNRYLSMPTPWRTRPWLVSAWMKRGASVARLSDAPRGLVGRFFGTCDRACAITSPVRRRRYPVRPVRLHVLH